MFLSQYDVGKKEEEKILKIEWSYKYWKETLFEKCVRIFEWENLPFPQKEIEMRLLLSGYCGFIDDKFCGFMVADGGMSGATQYFDEFTQFTYAAATAHGGQVPIDKKCVIINNTALRNPLYPLICRYASLLAHAEVSLKCALVNLRSTNTYTTNDNSTAESIKSYNKKIYNGEHDVIIDDSLVNAVQNVANGVTTNTGVKDCIDARNEILRSFYNDIGVRYNRDKKERMITSEVEQDEQLLLFNINDMLHQREKATEKINELFGLNVSVKLSSEFGVIENEADTDEHEIETEPTSDLVD